MLVLSRKVGERVLIGGSVVVTVVAARGGTIRLGFEAPRETEVLRQELSSCRLPAGRRHPSGGPASRNGA